MQQQRRSQSIQRGATVNTAAPSLRAVIYARYSSEHQREASIDDQIKVCRRYGVAQGWTIVESYSDAAISGASAILRPGFQRLVHDAERRTFDLLICEAIDRLGRKLADVATMYDRLTFLGVKVHATSVGPVTQVHIGIMGTMAQMMLTDMRDKVKRGQLGRARAGRSPGGLAFGYEVVPQAADAKEGGERRIVPAEAAVVVRVFREYAAGRSPRKIAHLLNEEGVPGPGGRPWGDTTVRGQADRGTGLLNNSVYNGLLSWNRCSYVKDPRTGLRVARVNPSDQWEEVAVPELRIVHAELWQAVKARQAAVKFEVGKDASGRALNRAHRRKYLLSGLLTWVVCGGGYTIVNPGRFGCAAHRSKSTHSNSHTITQQHLDERVLSGLKERMLSPHLVGEFIRAFAEEAAAGQVEAAGQRTRLTRELADVHRRLDGVLRAVENGAWSDTLHARLSELEQRKAELTRQSANASTTDTVVVLHPNAAEIYKQKVANLAASLANPNISQEAGEALAALIDRIVLTPSEVEPDRLAIEVRGELAAVLSAAGAGCGDKKANTLRARAKGGTRTEGEDVVLSVVAGVGFEPTTFRL